MKDSLGKSVLYVLLPAPWLPKRILHPKGTVALRISVLRVLPVQSPTDLSDPNSLKRVN